MTESYLTLSEISSKEIVICKSRFIGYAAPCSDESEATSFIQYIRDNHKTAKHHCYAYVIGENCSIMRYSDDGEPGGTAGMPIMDVLRNKGIINCCVVVVRYFGGILLGTGGLVRAYTQAAVLAVESAGIVCMEMTCEECCEIPYSVWDKFRYTASNLPVKIDCIEYRNNISFHLHYRKNDKERVLQQLMGASDRKMKSSLTNELFYSWPMEKN